MDFIENKCLSTYVKSKVDTKQKPRLIKEQIPDQRFFSLAKDIACVSLIDTYLQPFQIQSRSFSTKKEGGLKYNILERKNRLWAEDRFF